MTPIPPRIMDAIHHVFRRPLAVPPAPDVWTRSLREHHRVTPLPIASTGIVGVSWRLQDLAEMGDSDLEEFLTTQAQLLLDVAIREFHTDHAVPNPDRYLVWYDADSADLGPDGDGIFLALYVLGV